MDNSTSKDAELEGKVTQWRVPFDELGKQIIGTAATPLDQSTCQANECTLGNAVADSMLWYRTSGGSKVDGAIMNAGGIRASIDEGEVSKSEVLTSFPFLNGVVELSFTGQELWDIFEG